MSQLVLNGDGDAAELPGICVLHWSFGLLWIRRGEGLYDCIRQNTQQNKSYFKFSTDNKQQKSLKSKCPSPPISIKSCVGIFGCFLQVTRRYIEEAGCFFIILQGVIDMNILNQVAEKCQTNQNNH